MTARRIWLMALCASGILLTFAPREVLGQPMGDWHTLSPEADGARAPQVALAGRAVYVVWVEGRSESAEVFLSRSQDSGGSFAPALRLSGAGRGGSDPQVLALGRRVYVAWTGGGVFFRASRDAGQTWGPMQQLATSGASARLAASGDTVYVAWQHTTGDELGDVLLRASADQGATFGPTLEVSEGGGFGDCQLAARGDTVWVVWDEWATNDSSDIFLRRSIDRGRTFGPVTRLIQSEASSRSARLAVEGNNVYVAWEECALPGPGCDILLRRSRDGGTSFAPVQDVSRSTGRAVTPQLAVASGRVHLVWQDAGAGNPEVLFARSTDEGATFSSALNLSSSDDDSLEPRLTLTPDGVQVAWLEGPVGGREVLLRTSPNAGLAFRAAQAASAGLEDADAISLTTAPPSGPLHLTWEARSSGNPGVVYRRVELPPGGSSPDRSSPP